MPGNPRWDRRAESLAWPEVDEWPTVDVLSLPIEERESYLKKARAVRMYVEAEELAVIREITGVPAYTTLRLIKKCVAQHRDGRVFGFRALVPGAVRKPYKRQQPLVAGPLGSRGGYSGALQTLLSRIPDAEQTLLETALKRARVKGIALNRLEPWRFHRMTLTLFESNGVSESEWPFNTHHKGARSINKLFHRLLESSPEVAAREHSGNQAKARTDSGRAPRLLEFEEPYDAVELDAYSINALFSVLFKDPDNFDREFLAERIWLIAAVLKVTGAVLGYIVVYKAAVTAEDVKKLLRKISFESWARRNLTIPGIGYSNQGGFPSEAVEGCRHAAFSALYVDGALAHLSRAVYDQFRRASGCLINIGPPEKPARRPMIENLFGQISKEIFLAHPTSTGTNPQKHRAKNAESIALKYRVRAEESEELLDVYLANHNGRINEGIYNNSPLNAIRAFSQQRKSHFLMRYMDERIATGNSVLHQRVTCTVRGGIQTGEAPFIQYKRAHYSNAMLKRAPELAGTQLTCVLEDPEEARVLRAFLPNGAEFGYLEAQGRWGKAKHSFETRDRINALIVSNRMCVGEGEDPVAAYLHFLASQGTKKKPITRKNATKAALVARESGLPLELPRPAANRRQRVFDTLIETSLMERPLPDFKKILGR